MRKFFLASFPLFLSGAMFLQAQNMATTKLTWTVDTLIDLTTNVSTPYHCVFTTNKTQPIIWSQKDGKFISSLTTQSLSGEWLDVGETGKIVYTVSINGQIGTLVFERNAQGLQITLDVTRANGNRLSHRYMVVSLK